MERGKVYVVSQSANSTFYLIKPGYVEETTVVAKLGNNTTTPFTLTFNEQQDRITILTMSSAAFGNIVIKRICD